MIEHRLCPEAALKGTLYYLLCPVCVVYRSTEVSNFVWNLLSVIAEEENLELRYAWFVAANIGIFIFM